MQYKKDIINTSLIFILCLTMIFSSYKINKKIESLNNQIEQLKLVQEDYISNMKKIQKEETLNNSKINFEIPKVENNQSEKKEDPNLKLLAQLIESESGTQSFEGRLAVGTVVMNRVVSGKFPNNIKDVIFQKNQFSVVDNGEIYNEPSEESIKAAKKIMEGTRVLGPEVLYFYNPKIVRLGNWIRGRKTIKVIGDHAFAI